MKAAPQPIPATAHVEWVETPGIGWHLYARVRVAHRTASACLAAVVPAPSKTWRWRLVDANTNGRVLTLDEAKAAALAAANGTGRAAA